VEELKRIMEEFALARSNQCTMIQNHSKLAAADVTQILSPAPFAEFLQKYNFTNVKLWKTVRKIEDFPYKLTNINVIKEGLLYLPSTLIKNRWFPTMAVLTESGYLHLFTLTTAKYQALLENYEKNERNVTNWGQLIRKITLKKSNATFQQSTYTKSVLSYITILKHRISLGKPRTSIKMITHPKNHLFEIITKAVAKKGIFSSKTDFTNFSFKTHNQTDLCEWIAAIHVLFSYFRAQLKVLFLLGRHRHCLCHQRHWNRTL
jgi:hypothetical protein